MGGIYFWIFYHGTQRLNSNIEIRNSKFETSTNDLNSNDPNKIMKII